MSILQFVIVLILIGVVLWAINRLIPMNATIKGIVNVVVILITIVYCLQFFGILGNGAWFLK